MQKNPLTMQHNSRCAFISFWFHSPTLEWQNLCSLSREDQLKRSDRLRIQPKIPLILERDSAPSLYAEEGKKERQVLQTILSRPEFQYNQIKKDPVQWPVRFLNWVFWLFKKMVRFTAKIFNTMGNWFRTSTVRPGLLSWVSNPWSVYALMAALAIAMLIILAKFGQSLICNQEEGEVLPPQHAALNLPDSLRESPGYWAGQADLFMSQGKTREAFRSLYLALLVGFHRLNYIDFHRCRTNWNYLIQFRGEQKAKVLFRELTHSFDLVWYGRHPLPQADYQRYRQAVRGVLNV
ncbi:MAG: DUF4129 domain-containing protein [bacterium]